MMNYLILGIEGFIGKHLRKKIKASGMDLKFGRDCNNLKDYPKKADVIFHLAADLNPVDDRDIHMNRVVQEYWKKTGAHLIYTSSASIYQPDNLYAIQKLYGEYIFKGASILRLFNVYGEGGSGIVDKIKNGEFLSITGKGEQTRDFIHVEDVIDELIDASKTRFDGIKEVGNGIGVSVNSLLEKANIDFKYVEGDCGIMHSVSDDIPDIKREQRLYDYIN